MKTSGEISRLRRIAEDTRSDPESKEAMEELRKINKTYHWCPEWDYMVICNADLEFQVCLCCYRENE